jgi:hypothetical protein
VYWSDLDKRAVYRVAVRDAGAIENMTGSCSAVNVYAIAVTASWLVWAELEGSTSTEFVSGYNWGVPLTPDAGVAGSFTTAAEFNRNVAFIAADDLGIYITGKGDGLGGGVGRYPLPRPNEGIGVAGDTAPGAIAVSRTHDIFWVDQGSENAVRRARYDDTDASPEATWVLVPDTVAYGATPIAIGVDQDAVYWANAGAPYEIAKVRLADLPR